ncbi:hypothetical protein [Pontibacter fetidus]|uniref:Uncharacterized protein n=1 Tax=Pontibacter fetidus TaxID=2700082 RepID=A0A6B2H1Z5_9BACT|nr:hypothetical protein [Pontibacter fetidus]NDK54636.1 hypothetical protein [Pontibacter fetidus]
MVALLVQRQAMVLNVEGGQSFLILLYTHLFKFNLDKNLFLASKIDEMQFAGHLRYNGRD